jgi:hypothetical protein
VHQQFRQHLGQQAACAVLAIFRDNTLRIIYPGDAKITVGRGVSDLALMEDRLGNKMQIGRKTLPTR